MSATQREAEDESYFVSMTDLMVGMLFIFIILLMVFALKLKKQETEVTEAIKQLTQANAARDAMLEQIGDAMAKRGVTVIVDSQNGVLRLPESILFASGDDDLNVNGKAAVCRLADVLAQTLPEYALMESDPARISEKGARLEAVFVEGHTDDSPYRNDADGNWGLSARRAISVYKTLRDAEPALEKFRNAGIRAGTTGQRLLGVSGYADSRPVPEAAADGTRTYEGSPNPLESQRCGEFSQAADKVPTDQQARNRRIDLRFIMASPRPEAVNKVEQRLGTGAETQ